MTEFPIFAQIEMGYIVCSLIALALLTTNTKETE